MTKYRAEILLKGTLEALRDYQFTIEKMVKVFRKPNSLIFQLDRKVTAAFNRGEKRRALAYMKIIDSVKGLNSTSPIIDYYKRQFVTYGDREYHYIGSYTNRTKAEDEADKIRDRKTRIISVKPNYDKKILVHRLYISTY